MRIKLLVKLISVVGIILSIAMFPSLIISIFLDNINSTIAFIISILFLLLPSIIGFIFTKTYKGKYLTTKDGFFLVTLSWIIVSVLASFPFYFSSTLNTLADCFFEAVSGITTTGATVIVDVESLPKSILLWRSITHWLGGVGIVVLTVSLVPLLGIGGLQLLKAEASGLEGAENKKMTPRIAKTAKVLWLIYIALTTVCFIALKLGGMNFFDAINHSMSAMSSGGFSTKNSSIAYFNSPTIEWILTISMFFSGINFSIFFLLIAGKIKEIYKNTELKLYLIIITLTALTIAFKNYIDSPKNFSSFLESTRQSFFHVISLMTTTGFATTNYTAWPFLSQFLLLFLIFIGGCAGSTAGGFKVIRFAVLIKQALNEIKRIIHPRGIFLIRINKIVISKEVVYSVFAFFFLYFITVFIVAFVLSNSNDLITSISGGFAMVTNSGLGLGKVGPTGTYAPFSEGVKILLSFAMIIGRLEIYTFFAIFTPYFWKKF